MFDGSTDPGQEESSEMLPGQRVFSASREDRQARQYIKEWRSVAAACTLVV